MPSLVKKWQSIQRELDEEENSSSSEEDRETTAQRRIEEWKQQQLMRYEPWEAAPASAALLRGTLPSSAPPQGEHFLVPCRGREWGSESLAPGGGTRGWGRTVTLCHPGADTLLYPRSGMAERNANFEALPEDWRARLKRRKTASST